VTQEAQQPAPQKSFLPLAPVPRRARTHTQRIRTPDNLEVVREVIEPEVVASKFFWRETVRPKYVPSEDRSLPPVIAPAPARVAERGSAAPGLLAHLLVSKYADHIPFYRLEMIFWRRHGVFIARQQMVLWVGQ
jgi:transposase